MVDANVILRRWLTDPAGPVWPLLGSVPRIYAGALPEGFNPESGLGILIHVRGGFSEIEMPVIHPSVQITTYAPQNKFAAARGLYLAIYDWIHGKFKVDFGSDGHVISCLEEVQGQDIVDPDEGWATVVAFYGMTLR